jgi:hypothetical protein
MLAIKSETKVIRPFTGAYSIRTFLNDAELHLFENDPESAKEVRVLADLEGDDIPVLIPNLSRLEAEKICLETGVSKSELNFVVTLTVPSAKKFIKLVELPLLDAIDDVEIPLSNNIFAAASQRGGATISIAVVLNSELDEKPLRVSKYGHWLVKKDFRLTRSDDDSQKIDIQPLTDEIRKKFSLPQSTAFFVDGRESEMLTDPEGTIKSAVTLYFEPDLLAKLRRETKASEALLILVLGQILPSITSTALRKSQIINLDELDSRCPLYEFFRQISLTCKIDIAEVFKAAQTDPERFNALIQAQLQTLKLMKEIS